MYFINGLFIAVTKNLKAHSGTTAKQSVWKF